MKKHKLEWYIPETDSFIYDEDVARLLIPRLNDSISSLNSIEELVNLFKENNVSSSLTDKYLEYEELLSQIQTILEEHFNR